MVKLIFEVFRQKVTLRFCETWVQTTMNYDTRARNCAQDSLLASGKILTRNALGIVESLHVKI